MQKYSTPRRYCSALIGRLLLEWYSLLEDYSCLLLGHAPFLPQEWRFEDVFARQLAAALEFRSPDSADYHVLVLDDLLPQLLAIQTRIVTIFSEIPGLKKMNDIDAAQVAARLATQLWSFDQDVKEFYENTVQSGIFQLIDPVVDFSSAHEHCCPPFPSTPSVLRFPLAVHLRVMCLAVRIHARMITYPPLRTILLSSPVYTEYSWDEETAFDMADEICRTFAGLEHTTNNPNDDFLYFPQLVAAGFACSPKFRTWIWSKLSHLEKLGGLFCRPIMKTLEIYWDRPNLVMEGFAAESPMSLDDRIRELDTDDIVTATEQAQVSEPEVEAVGEEGCQTFGESVINDS